MANIGRDNMLNEEQESSQSNSSNGSGALQQQSSGGGGFQLKSSILRQPATFGSGAGAGGGFGGIFGGAASSAGGSSGPINSFNLKPSVLKPSHFGGGFGGFGEKKAGGDDQSQTNSNSFGVNPFLRTQVSEEDGSDSKKDDADTAADKEEQVDPLAKLNRATLPKSNLFANVKAITQNTGFVFGQNVHERVTGDNLQSSESGSVPTAGLSFSSTVASTTTAAANSNDSSSSNPGAVDPASAAGAGGSGPTATGTSGANKPEGAADESLEEAARRYEESRGALKRKFDEVETVTGEEDERNVVEANCKLFAFAKSNWEERGHGTLRLNDKDSKESRVVFRQAGNLRVLINTKVWSGMTAEQSSPKSLRLTAMDNNGQVKVFLVMTRPEVIGKLHKELSKRIQVAKENATAEEEDALLQDDDGAGKENNNDNATATTTTKPSDCEDDPTTAESAATKDADSEEPCAKKRLSSSS